MKKLFALMFCAAAMLCTGCSDDDDNNVAVETANLIGKWELYRYYDGEYDEWDYYGDDSDSSFIYQLEFKDDGTCLGISNDGVAEWYDELVYKLEGNMLTITYPEYADIARIDKLTASELVLAYDYEGDNGQICTDKEYYKRIS